MERSERGSTLIEFGLVIIVLLMFIFGIIDMGRFLFAYHWVANTAREATRFAIVRGANCSSSQGNGIYGECPAQITQFVQDSAAANSIPQQNLIITPVYNPNPTRACLQSSDGTFDTPGCVVEVTITYPFKFIFPLLPTGTYNITSSSQMLITN